MALHNYAHDVLFLSYLSGIEIGDLIIFSNKIIGQGAFGTVFKGEWQQIPCAAKMLSILGNEVYTGIPITQQGGVQEEALSRFKKECEFMKTLRHPNVVAYYDTVFHPESNLPLLVMELMSTSLRQYITTHAESLSVTVQLNLCHNIAAALEYLHGKNIIHRDLCGENVLLNYSDDNIPVAKVTDFGVSRKNIDMTHSLTAISHRPGYLPPEAPEYPTDYDSSLDIFMFGAVMTQIARKCPAIKSKAERQELVRELGEVKHPLNPIVCRCLDDRKENRPKACMLCAILHYANDLTHDTDRIAEEMLRLCPIKIEGKKTKPFIFLPAKHRRFHDSVSV